MSLDTHLIVEVVMEKGTMKASGNVQNMPKKWMGSWPAKCDVCKYLHQVDNPLDKCDYFVDGVTKSGPWALMCPGCHEEYGYGIGTGRGQKYDSKTLEKLEG